MPDFWDLTALAVLAILLLSTLTRSMLGFGDSLIAMPLLALVVDVKVATPLSALVSATTVLGLLAREWRHVEFRAALPLALCGLAAIPLGLWLVTAVDERIVKLILAAVVIGFGVYRIVKPPLWRLRTDRTAPLFGFCAGLLGGAYNTPGAPIMVYGSLRNWPPEQFRATMQGYMALTVGLVLAGHYLKGLWTTRVFLHYISALPVVFISIYLGGRLARHVGNGRFALLIHLFLIVVGVILVVTVLSA
jgi:uncharacterized membrane protein YfcA